MNSSADLMQSSPSLFVWIASALTLFSSMIVLISPNPVSSAVALLGTLFSSAALYFALGNYFMGSVQILVYAGAIAVLFVFIVMLLDLKPQRLRFFPGRKVYIGFAAGVGILFAVALVLWGYPALDMAPFLNDPTLDNASVSAKGVAQYFVSKHQVAFQVSGLLIFGAILGALVLARDHLRRERRSVD